MVFVAIRYILATTRVRVSTRELKNIVPRYPGYKLRFERKNTGSFWRSRDEMRSRSFHTLERSTAQPGELKTGPYIDRRWKI